MAREKEHYRENLRLIYEHFGDVQLIRIKEAAEYCGLDERVMKRAKDFPLTVLGHANYDEYGKDIVCAGVSAIVQALIGWLENNPCNVECISIDEQRGEVIITCEGGEDIAAVFYMASIGLEQIAVSYPDHVQIDIIGIAD